MFKKLLYVSFAIFILIFMWTANSSMKSYGEISKREIYLYKSSSVCDVSKTPSLFKKGESFRIDNNVPVCDILAFYGAKEVFSEETENGKSYYAFSDKLKYKKEVNGKVISLHIFVGKSETIIGFPIIFGSY